MRRTWTISLAIFVLASLLATLAYLQSRPSEQEQVLEAANDFYESRAPFERPMPYTQVPEGLGDMRAETCGACHQEIYKEWAVSTHRRAWLDDAQFQAELAKSRGEHGGDGDVGWLCVNCHTPLVNQLPQLVVGLEDGKINKPIYADNPVFDAKLQKDAITCAACHVRDGIVYGPRGNSPQAPHPVARGEHLMGVEVCTDCHQAEMIYEEQVLGCFFSTGREWEKSPAAAAGQTCQDCHMPMVERKAAEAYDVPVRKTRRHWFGGSLIPKKPEYEDGIAPLRAVFGDGIDVRFVDGKTDIEPFDFEELAEKDMRIAEERERACEGECRQVSLVVENISGHRMPSGDPERHIDLTLTARGPDDEIFSQVWYRLNSRYEWWPKIEQQSDTRLEPGETRALVLEVPAQTTRITVRGEKYRMYQDAFDYHELEGSYVRGRTFLEEEWLVTPGAANELEDAR